MTLLVSEVADLALSRMTEITDQFPQSRTLMYRRIGVRQQLLFAEAAKINVDFYGGCAVTALDADGNADLSDIADPVPKPEKIGRIFISDKGTSAYQNGDDISIVPSYDVNAALAPRMILRDRVLVQVGDDLDDVAQITILHSRVPASYGANDGDQATQIEAPYDELLVIDLTKYLLKQSRGIGEDVKQLATGLLDTEEAALMSAFVEHVRGYSLTTSRFDHTPPNQNL